VANWQLCEICLLRLRVLNVTLFEAFGGRGAARRWQASKRLRREGGGKTGEYGGLEHSAGAQQDEEEGVGEVKLMSRLLSADCGTRNPRNIFSICCRNLMQASWRISLSLKCAWV
jgi:hypothetical protein